MIKFVFHLIYFIISSILYFIILCRNLRSVIRQNPIIKQVELKHNVYTVGTNITRIVSLSLRNHESIYELQLSNNKKFRCAGEHLLCLNPYNTIYAKDIKPGDSVITYDGIKQIVSVKKKNYRAFMFDMSIDSPDYLYYTDDILSHNSITVAIFIAWYLAVHTNRNILLTSATEVKVKELMKKLSTILKYLPFYLKSGVVENNVMSKEFDDGNRIIAETTTNRTGASFTGHLVYADEFAVVDKKIQEEFYTTLYPTMSSSDESKMIITSTARGIDKFYQIYKDAVDGINYFNPMRTDYFEYPDAREPSGFRGEIFKKEMIAQLGSEASFNQEFGNQFLSGNTLMLNSSVIRKLTNHRLHFVKHEIGELDENDVEYRGYLEFHPDFDLNELKNPGSAYVISIDLADGVGGDYTMLNFFQILPMNKKEIEKLKIYSDEKDFFKLAQVAIFRSNVLSLEKIAKFLYHMIINVFGTESIKIVLEVNHEGNYFKKLVSTLYGESNEVDEDCLFVHFHFDVTNEETSVLKSGLTNDTKTKEFGRKLMPDKIKANQIIVQEHRTVEESISMTKTKKGKFVCQLNNDDAVLTVINVMHFYQTPDYLDQVDELLESCPDKFKDEIGLKLKVSFVSGDEGGIEDLL